MLLSDTTRSKTKICPAVNTTIPMIVGARNRSPRMAFVLRSDLMLIMVLER